MQTLTTIESILERIEPAFYVTVPDIQISTHHTMTRTWSPGSKPAISFKRMPDANGTRMVGLLFLPPETELAKTDVLPRINQYHLRSGPFTYFFFAGYSADWSPNNYPDQQAVCVVQNEQWYYSAKAFCSVLDQFESMVNYKYSGQSDLLLVTAYWCSDERKAKLDYNTCAVIQLEEFIKNKSVESLPVFLESLFNYSKSNPEPTTYEFSDLHLVRTSRQSLTSWLLKKIGMEGYFNKNKGMAVRDITKR